MCKTFPLGLFSLCSVQVSLPFPHIVLAGSIAHLFWQTKTYSEKKDAQQRGLLQVQSFPSTYCQWFQSWFPGEVPTKIFFYGAFNHCPRLSALMFPCCSLAPIIVISVFHCFKPCSHISFVTSPPHPHRFF